MGVSAGRTLSTPVREREAIFAAQADRRPEGEGWAAIRVGAGHRAPLPQRFGVYRVSLS